MSLAPIVRTSYLQLYARRIPDIMMWGAGIVGVLYWPHAIIKISNMKCNAPNVNAQTFIGYGTIY
jgi:hypothetical protein